MIKVFIEVERGSRDRNRYNEKTLEYKGTHRIPIPYPYAYGFIIGTKTADGDSVDCYVITKDKLKVGTTVECDPIGLLEQFEDEEIDHKVLAAIPGQNVELSQRLIDVQREFIYRIFAQFPKTNVTVGRIIPRQTALHYIGKSS